MKVFVAGGSKGVGRETITELLAKGKQVVALVRAEDQAQKLRAAGVTAIVGDAFVYKVL